VHGKGAAIIYEKEGCEGTSISIFSYDNTNVNYYNLQNLTAVNYINDHADSIMVPPGYTVELYPDEGWDGKGVTI